MTSPLLADGVKTYNPGLGEYASGSYFDYAEDALGSVGGLMNSSQRQQEAYLSDAFGLPVSSNGTLTFAQGQIDGFAATSGYQTDNDTGLIRCGNRYYNPFLGRFITQDHAKSGTNWYEYCGNNPTGGTDPTGESIQDPTTPDALSPNGGFDESNAWARGRSGYLEGQADTFIKNLRISVELYSAHITGPSGYGKKVADALLYILQSPIGQDEIFKMSTTGSDLNITYTSGDGGVWQSNGNVIMWNPETSFVIAVTNKVYGSMSPSDVLEHELGHDALQIGGTADPPPVSADKWYVNTLTGNDVVSLYENPFREWEGKSDRVNHWGWELSSFEALFNQAPQVGR